MEICKRTREDSHGPQGAVNNFTKYLNQIYKQKKKKKSLKTKTRNQNTQTK